MFLTLVVSLSLRAALPLDFDRIKVIFDTSSIGSLALNSHIITIQLIVNPIAIGSALAALTLTLNTFALYKSTLRRFEKVDYTTYSIVQFFVFTPSVRPPSLPFHRAWLVAVSCLQQARLHKAYHLCKSFVTISKNLFILYPW